MKVLVATAFLQGHRQNDRFTTTEGELVVFPYIDSVGSEGGWFTGTRSYGATTTARVVELPLTFREYFELVYAAHQEAWRFEDSVDVRVEIIFETAHLEAIASDLPVGAVVERDGPGWTVRVRRLAA